MKMDVIIVIIILKLLMKEKNFGARITESKKLFINKKSKYR